MFRLLYSLQMTGCQTELQLHACSGHAHSVPTVCKLLEMSQGTMHVEQEQQTKQRSTSANGAGAGTLHCNQAAYIHKLLRTAVGLPWQVHCEPAV